MQSYVLFLNAPNFFNKKNNVFFNHKIQIGIMLLIFKQIAYLQRFYKFPSQLKAQFTDIVNLKYAILLIIDFLVNLHYINV